MAGHTEPDENWLKEQFRVGPRELCWAPSRQRKAEPEEPRPFNKAALCEELRRMQDRSKGWDWNSLELPVRITPKEAAFWLFCVGEEEKERSPAEVIDDLAYRRFSAKHIPSAEELFRRLTDSIFSRKTAECFMAVAVAVAGPLRVIEFLLSPNHPLNENAPRSKTNLDGREVLFAGLPFHLVSVLSAEEHADACRRVSSVLPLGPPIRPNLSWPAGAWALMCALGMSDELRGALDQGPIPRSIRLPTVVFALGSPEEVVQEALRRQLRIAPTELGRWFAATGALGLEPLLRRTHEEGGSYATSIFQALDVYPDELVSAALGRLTTAPDEPLSRWLCRRPDSVVRAYVEALDLPMSAPLRRVLQECAAAVPFEELPEAMRQFAAPSSDSKTDGDFEAEPAAELYAATPEWLARHVADFRSEASLPGWARGGRVAPVWLSPSSRLDDEATDTILKGLRASRLGRAHPLIAELIRSLEAERYRELVWSAVTAWSAAGGETEERWAVEAIAHLPDPHLINRLGEQVQVWASDGKAWRARLAAKVLTTIGTDDALAYVRQMAHAGRSRAVRERAREQMVENAGARLLAERYSDSRIPRCGLDESGTRLFDFGSRSFQFVMLPGLEAAVRHADGSVTKSLPRKRASDDQKLAAGAAAQWKLFRKQIKKTVKLESRRLRTAMIDQRAWDAAHFRACFVMHPVMRWVTQTLVWSVWHGDELRGTFRVTDELSFADVEDEEFAFPSDEPQIRLVHPLHLRDQEVANWSELLADYELVPPFPQMSRPVHRLSDSHQDDRILEGLDEFSLAGGALHGILNARDWDPVGYGRVRTRGFAGTNIHAVLEVSPGFDGKPSSWPDQKLVRAYFCRGVSGESARIRQGTLEHAIRLTDVDPIALSEVLADIDLLASKA